MSEYVLARGLDLEPGMVVQWIEPGGYVSDNPHERLMLLRPGKYPGDWMAVRIKPRRGEREGQEWLIASSQIEAGRYGVVGRIRPKATA